MPRRPRMLAALLLAGIPSPVCPPLAAASSPAVPSPLTLPLALSFSRFVLSNGLTVLVHTDHSVPNVFVGLSYGVGAKDEPVGQTGFAHLFEHLMFQRTGNRSTDFMSPVVAAGGSNVNGVTTGDTTRFYETMPTGSLDRLLWLESDRMASLADGIDQAALDQQRGVVKNEKRQRDLQPGAYSRQRLLAGFYPPGHPYSHDPIGSMVDLDRATLAQVKRWFGDYYGARNAVLVLSGDIDVETARRKVAHYFADVPAGRRPPARAAWTPELRSIRRETIHDAIPNATLTRVWPIASKDPRDIALLQLAVATLTTGRDAPLRKALVDNDGPALDVTAAVDEQRLASDFMISVALRPGASPERAGALIDQALARYRAVGPDPKRLGPVVLRAEAELLQSLEGTAAVGGRLLSGEADHGDPAYVLRQREWYSEATADDLRRIVSTWLGRPYYKQVALPGKPEAMVPEPEAEPTGVAAIAAAPPPMAAMAHRVRTSGPVDRTRMPDIDAPDGTVRFPPVTETRLPNGLRLVVAERHRLPLVQFVMSFPVGTLSDPAETPDLARQAFDGLGGGCAGLSEVDLERAAGDIGVSMLSEVSPQRSTFRWSAVASKLEPSFALVSDVLRRPVYPQAWIDRQAAQADAGFDDYEQTPQNAAPALLARALWGGEHPAGRIERRGQAHAVTRQALQAFHDREIVPGEATLYAIGDITPEQATVLARRYFGDWRGNPPAPVPIPAPEAAAPRVVLVDAPGASQSAISVGQLMPPFDPSRAPAEHIADAVLATSLSGRLDIDLREKRGWSYGFAGGIADVPGGQRTFSAGGTVETARTAESIALIRRDIADLAGAKPITDGELEANRISAIREIPASFATSGAMLDSIQTADAFGLPHAYAAGSGDRLAAVTLPQVRAAAMGYRSANLTWVVVGDLAQIERDVRALDLGPVEVWDVYGRRLR